MSPGECRTQTQAWGVFLTTALSCRPHCASSHCCWPSRPVLWGRVSAVAIAHCCFPLGRASLGVGGASWCPWKTHQVSVKARGER